MKKEPRELASTSAIEWRDLDWRKEVPEEESPSGATPPRDINSHQRPEQLIKFVRPYILIFFLKPSAKSEFWGKKFRKTLNPTNKVFNKKSSTKASLKTLDWKVSITEKLWMKKKQTSSSVLMTLQESKSISSSRSSKSNFNCSEISVCHSFWRLQTFKVQYSIK